MGVTAIDKNVFNDKIKDGVSFVDFYADWCMPCKMLAPIVDEVSEDFDGKVNFYKVNIDENPEIAAKYGIMSIPTVIAFKNGEAVEKSVGLVNKDTLNNIINKALS